jgi:tetratricopeptide (TPR) repeat protein
LRGFFIEKMLRLNILLVFLIPLLFSCGGDVDNNEIEDNTVKTDTTVSEQVLAFREVNEQLKSDINNTGLYLKRARLYQKYKDLPSAINDIDRAIKIDSIIPDLYLLKAELLKLQGKYQESKLALDQCMLVDNANVEARIGLGWIALIAQNYEQALDYADAALKRNMYSAEAYYLKGMIFIEKEDTTTAISSFKTAVEQENDYYEAYIQLGLLHYYQDNDLAKGYFKNALRIRPKSLEALYDYAIYCQDTEEFNEAIKTYHEILAIQKYKEPYFNLGYIHQEYLKVYDVAIENYTKAVELEPSYYEAFYNRALCYEIQGNNKLAEADLRMALKINPTYTFAAKALERVLGN